MARKSSRKPTPESTPPEPPPGPGEAAYFLSLTFQNLRCFGPEPQTLDLSDGQGRPARWTILLGENGTGKTTLLKCLAAVSSERPLDVAGMLRYPGTRQSVVKVRVGRGSPDDGFNITDAKEFVFWMARNAIHVDEPAVFEADSRASFDRDAANPSLVHGVYHHPDLSALVALQCFAYGAGRGLGQGQLRPREPAPSQVSAFDDHPELIDAEDWLLRLDYSASKATTGRKAVADRLEQVRRLLIEILPDVDDIRFAVEPGVTPTPRVEFRTPFGWVPLRQLGYGYQTLIAWMVDLASRMVERYPDRPDPLSGPAVVLVDEIDLHLHPTWQRMLVGYLTERFPNVQFIVTAHSPLIVQAAEGANLAVLRREGDRVVVDNNVESIKNWRVDQILTSDLFGLESARPPSLDRAIDRRKAILSKSSLSGKDKQELLELDRSIGPLPTGETASQAREMLDLIRETRELLAKPEEDAP